MLNPILPVFEVQLWRFRLHRLQLDGYMLVGVEVLSEPKFSEISAADFLSDTKVRPDH